MAGGEFQTGDMGTPPHPQQRLVYLLRFIAVTPIKREKLTRFKIAADTLMTFAGDFFIEEIERQSRYVVQTEVSFVSHGRDKINISLLSDYYL